MDKKNLNAGHRKRIRQKLLKNGEEAFFDYELIELLLTFSIPFRDVKPIAKNLISTFDDLKGVLGAAPDELMKLKGIGENSVALIQLLKAINSRYLREMCKEFNNLKSPYLLTEFAKSKISDAKRENYLLIFLDSKGNLIECEIFAHGTPKDIKVSVNAIVIRCYKYDASYLALAHNHPSGDCNPSAADINFTNKLNEALKYNEIELSDHIIVSQYSSYSMKIHNIF